MKTGRRAGLLERGRELSELEAALGAVLAGEGGIVVVEGPAGIGKSELLRAAAELARVRGARPLTARGVELERELAFGAVRQLLEPVVQAAATEDRERLFAGAATPARQLFDTTAAVSRLAADPEFATLNALYWLLAGLADAEPLALVIDDAHWLDPPSLRLLEFLLPRVEELAALVVVATRPAQEDPVSTSVGRLLAEPGTRVIRPAALSRVGVGEFVRSRMGEDPDPEFVDACAEVTAGNPFYLAELLRELALDGGHASAHEVAVVRTIGPHRISLALRVRGPGSGDATALARALAVLGDDAPIDHVAALARLERDAATAAADTLTRESVTLPGAGLSFTHPIVRNAVYAALAPHERAAAHARAARLLHAAGTPIERVAAHLILTEPARDRWVVQQLQTAADVVMRQGSPESAVRYLRRAIAEPPDDPARPRLLLQLARAEASVAEPEAAAHFAEAHALAADERTRGDVAEAAATVLMVTGRMDEAFAMLAAAADGLASDDPDRALQLEAQLATGAMNDPAAAEFYLPRLQHITDDLAGDSPGSRMMLCQLAYQRMWQSRDAARAAALAERALGNGRLLEERGTEGNELNAAALTLICADRVGSATSLLDAAASQARERGSRFGFGLVSFLRGQLAYRQGRLQDVEADAQASLVVSFAVGLFPGVAAGSALLIAALLERGALAEADTALRDALNTLGAPPQELPPLLPNNLLLSAAGRLRLARGNVTEALAELHECGRRNQAVDARNPVLVPWRIDAALAHRARGELNAARSLAREELEVAREWGTPGTIGTAQRLEALLASPGEAIPLFREAVQALEASPARLELARTLVDLGAVLRRANRRTEAREPLAQGLDLADQCRASALAERAREELAATGARPRRARLRGVDALTASERRVARMAARGLGNVDIAQTLFVTRKTVEKHLGNAYTKLGVSSRAELPKQFGDLDGLT